MGELTHPDLLIEPCPNGVALVTMNRPERLNALSRSLRAQLLAALGALDRDPEVQAVILTGAGDRAFAAGQDLSEAQEFSPASIEGWIDEWSGLYDGVLSMATPTVAAVNGYAVGAAFQLALVCDIRIASERARFGMPEIDDAIPCITGTWTLYELVGRGRAMDLVITGRMIDAAEALAWGVVSRVVPHHELSEAAQATASLLASKPATAMRLNKRWFRSLLVESLPATERFAREAHAAAFATGEPRRRMEEFLADRAEGRSR